MRKRLASLMASLFLLVGAVWAQAPVATPEQAITGLLNRIGGDGAADKFEIVIDASLAENGKDVFVITSQNSKPCIKGNTQLSVATGINWYLNHYAHINLTWNNLTTDLVSATLPVPGSEEKHVCNTTYRYNFNTCTFSYSMAFWTWERWQQEIDWMALHGINAPLNLVGLDVVTRKFLKELGVSDNDINAYIAGPGFIAWFAMNNLEGWGGTINATDVTMNGNPDWWYTRQENLCRNMLQRMRELGMQPVIPGFSGQVPNCIVNYSIDGFNSGDVVNNGTWAGGYTRPDILKPNTTSYQTFATVYYKHLHEVMGVSELYSMDPFHEGNLPSGVSNETCYPNIMVELDKYYTGVSAEDKTKNNVDEQPKWIIQYWQGVPQEGAFSAMSSYGDRFIGLDLFADNIYAGNAAKWRTNYYQGRPYVYCMLHNFGGRSGMHGRLETTMDGYFQALAKGNNCQGIGATPEGIETNPILYDMLFELPWMDVNNRPTANEWLAQYNQARYGTANEKTLEALKLLKKSVWDCKVNQQGTSEAVILARPNWTVNSVSSWSTSAIYWDTQDILEAADLLVAAEKSITSADGIANYNYDVIDVIRQAMVDYAAELLPLINAARNNDAEYTRLYQLYLQLMLDLDEMLSYDENFKLERWTSLARNIANEVSGTTENDRRWLEWNARTQITVWSNGNTDLHDYSNRCWAGLIKDFHYKRWKHFFENNGNAPSGGWFSGFEYPWTVDFTNYNYSTVTFPNDMTATKKAVETFGKYFGRVKGATKNYIFPMGVARKATASDVIPEVYRGQTVDLPLEIGKNVTISSVWVDLNNDGAKGNGETLPVANGQVEIPADATIGKTTAQVVYSDGTDITFNLALIEDISAERTVTAVAGANGSVAIEGTNELSITNAEAVKMTATANAGYNFANWTDANSNVVSNDNPFIYYGKEAATFTANFIQDKWGVPTEDKGDWGDATVKTSFVNALTFAYYNREPETIYEATVAPDNLFNTLPQIINVPQGASFDVTWSDNGDNGLKYCCLSAYIDLNADGDFTDEGELVKVAGTKGAQNTTACEGKINVLLPYDAPLGITHMRIRFDGAWKDNGYDATTKSYDAKAQLNRMCYELIINVTEGSAKAAHVVVESNNDAWGTAEVWTDETPGWTASNEWDVSASIPVHIKATKASEDVEFLGWYDQYNRLLTTELQYSMLAREDATYTARFRKALEIDGWVFEYRTEPGSEIVTNKLANSVNPEAGKTYYIYAPTNYNSVSATRYLYDNNGTLATNTTAGGSNYIWTCIVNSDNTYSFQNASGNYLANNGSYHISIGATAAKYNFEEPSQAGVSLVNAATYEGGKFMVTKHDGSAFNRNSSKTNGEWCSDYVFVEVTYPEVVVLTSVRKNGDHDLEIPETVEILGEQCKIVGFDNNLFKDNKDLWTISLPSTIEEMSNNKVFEGVVKGKGANESANSANYITTDLGTTCAAGEDWSISLTIEDNGNNFNQWGSALIATGSAPMNSTYGKGFQLYMQSTSNGGKLIVKLDNDNNNNALASISKGTKYRIDIVYTHANTQLVVTATPLTSVAALAAARSTYSTRSTNSLTLTQDMSDFSVVSHAIPEGVNITELEVRQGTEPDPFEGCNNLLNVEVADGCEDYYVAEGTLYRSGGVELHELADEEKEEEIRALGTLIDNTKALMDVIATSIDPVGKATEIALQTTEGQPYYIWCNNPHVGGNDGAGGVAALLDEDAGTYLHSNYSNKSTDTHDYLQIDNANPADFYNFKIAGQQRNGATDDYPKNIEILGSNNGTDWTAITTVTGLPNNSGATWSSDALTSNAKYIYYKFVVKTHNNHNGTPPLARPWFHMAKFDLFKLTSVVEVATEYKDIAKITNDEAANVYDNMVNALYVYNNGGTVAELQAAYDVLKPLYDALNDKKNALQYINQLNELVENTDALINKIATSVNPVGKATEIALQSTTSGDAYYIWCSNPHTGDNNDARGGVAALLDEDANTYLHTNWSSVSSTYDYLQIDNVNPVDLMNFKISGQQRADGDADRPKYIEIFGSDNNTDWTPIATVTGLPNTQSGTWESEALTSGANYAHYKFVVKTHTNENNEGRPYFHMAKFDLFKLTSVVEVAPGYKSLGGITNEEATAAYDLMAHAQYLCNNGGTTAELEETLNDLQTAYDALNAKQGKVLNGVYHINFDGGQVFVGYTNAAVQGLSNDVAGYKLFDAIVDNSNNAATAGSTSGDTPDHLKTLHNDAIAGKVAADELFTIVPNSEGTGYTISAQGLYLHSTRNGGWAPQLLSDDANQAGVYLIEESATAGLYKMKSNRNDIQYLNDWGPVFGNDKSDKNTGLSIFSFTSVTEYTLTVPASGYASVCLPFNVVLPEGVEAFDINDLTKQKLVSGEVLAKIAGAGEIVQAGTPMIIKAAEGNHTFAITMDSEGAKTSLEGSVLRGNYMKQALTVNANKKYILNGDVWELLEEARDIPANTCWIEAAEIDYDYNIDMTPEFVEFGGWKFRYEPQTNGIMLTDAALDGNGDLVIPAEVTVASETKKVVAIAPDFLHDNKTLTSIEFPATLVNLGFRTVEPMFGDKTTKYEGQPGDGGVYDGPNEVTSVGAHREYIFPEDPNTGAPFMVESSFAWRLTLDVTIDDPNINFNNYGSAIVSTHENSLADSYKGDMQIYMKAGHQDIMVKIDNADDRYRYTLPVLDGEGNETEELVAHDHFVFELEHDGSGGYQVVIYYDDGRAKMYSISASEGAKVKNFDRLYYSLPEGIHVKVKVDKLISEGLFVGCTNLREIKVDPANPTFKSCEHGVLYDKNGYYVMRIPEGETEHHFDIPSKVVKLYAGSFHGVKADIVLHSNPQIGVVPGHEDAVKDAKFYLSLDDIDNTIAEGETGYGGARDFTSANNNTYVNANYKRAPLAEGVYGTICLPFDIKENNAIMAKYDFYEFTNANAESLIFTQVTELAHNKPYLYKLKDGVETTSNVTNGLDVFQSAGEVTIETLAKFSKDLFKGDVTPLGAFVNHYVQTDEYSDKAFYYYKTSDKSFWQVTKKLNYRPYRAFFVVNNVQAAQATPRLSLQLLDGTVTDIDASLVEGMEAPEYYDLSGRRVLNPASGGIYIVNGKKVFIK